jgi:hypothetical protein
MNREIKDAKKGINNRNLKERNTWDEHEPDGLTSEATYQKTARRQNNGAAKELKKKDQGKEAIGKLFIH